jgi:hypothetical protein
MNNLKTKVLTPAMQKTIHKTMPIPQIQMWRAA